MSSRDIRPEDKAADLHGGQERGGPFGVAGSQTPPTLEVAHGVLNQMAQFVEVFVIVALNESVLLGRDHRIHPLSRRLFEDGVGVVAPVGQKMVCGYSCDQVARLGAIRRGTWRHKNSDRHTVRIHGQMYFGVEPPFVRLMA